MAGSIQDNKNPPQPDLFEAFDPRGNRRHAGYAVMHCDGASSGNPGKSGIGIVIHFPDKAARRLKAEKECRISEYIGVATNNVAEYRALIKGLEQAVSMGIRRIKVFLDSELLVRQMTGIYKVKNKNLIPLWIRAKELLKNFESFKITHVPREMNREADRLAREAVKNN